jgi:hypothetical protein
MIPSMRAVFSAFAKPPCLTVELSAHLPLSFKETIGRCVSVAILSSTAVTVPATALTAAGGVLSWLKLAPKLEWHQGNLIGQAGSPA